MNNKNFIKAFRMVALLEGVSTLLLFFVAMPMKYLFSSPQLISPVGMAHGLLFVAYVIFAFLAHAVFRWDTKTLVIVLIASLVPFGTFYIEKKYLKNL